MALEEGTTAPEMMLFPYSKRASYGFADTIDVHWGSCDEGDDEAGGGGEQGRNHQYAEPAYIQAVVGAGDPVAEPFPHVGAFATL
jgi:hypothetical protein